MNEELAIVKKSLWTCLLEKSTNFYTLHDNEAASVSCGVWNFGHLVTTLVFVLVDGEATLSINNVHSNTNIHFQRSVSVKTNWSIIKWYNTFISTTVLGKDIKDSSGALSSTLKGTFKY